MRAEHRARGAIFLVAVLVYLPGFWWGTPHASAEDRRKAWGVDDEPPLGPLAQLQDMLTPGVAPDANLGYPMLHSYIVLGAYAPYLGVLAATGRLSSPTASYPYGFSDPVMALRHLSLIAHLMSVVLAAGIVLAAYSIGVSFWGARAGWWAAVFTLLSYPMFYYARTSNVDVPVLFFAAWSLAALAHALTSGVTNRRLAAFGALAGLAMAVKEPIAALYLALPLALLVPRDGWAGFRAPVAMVKAMALTLVCAFVAYALGSGMVLDFARWKAHIASAFSVTQNVSAGNVAFMASYPSTWSGHLALLQAMAARLSDALTLPGLVLALAGVGLTLRRPRAGVWLLVAAASYLMVLFVVVRAVHLRYVMPATFVLGLFAAYAVAESLNASPRVVRRAGAVTAAVTVIIAALWGTDLTNAMIHDSRYAAGQWLLTAGKPGDRLEYFGAFQKNPPLPPWLESGLAFEYRGGAFDAPRDNATAELIRAGWRERKPRFIVLIPDHTSRPGEPFPHSCPPQVYESLEAGTTGYVQARFFQTSPLIPFLRRPRLDYSAVNPPVRIYVPAGDAAAGAGS
jgi:hypothetical protein